jgi:hypothetical protein
MEPSVTDFQPLQTFQYATLYIAATSLQQERLPQAPEDGPTVGVLIITSAQRVEVGESALEILDRLGGQGWLAVIEQHTLPGSTFPHNILSLVKRVEGVQRVTRWWQYFLRRQLT